MLSRFFLCAVAFAALATWPFTALADLVPYAGSGRLVALEPGLIVIQKANNQRDVIKFLTPDRGSITLKGKDEAWSSKVPLVVAITGQISPSQLAPGTLVRFRAIIDKKGTVTSELREATALLDPGRDERMGLYPDQREEDATGEGTPLLVKGRVVSNRKGTLIVNVGVRGENTNKGKVTATITDQTVVKIEGANLARARVGDDVEVTGVQVDGKDIGAERIIVTLRRAGGKPIGKSRADVVKEKPKAE